MSDKEEKIRRENRGHSPEQQENQPLILAETLRIP